MEAATSDVRLDGSEDPFEGIRDELPEGVQAGSLEGENPSQPEASDGEEPAVIDPPTEEEELAVGDRDYIVLAMKTVKDGGRDVTAFVPVPGSEVVQARSTDGALRQVAQANGRDFVGDLVAVAARRWNVRHVSTRPVNQMAVSID